MTIFDPNPHPDERIEWLRAQVEAYLNESENVWVPIQIGDYPQETLEKFVHWMEERFQPKGLFDR